MPKTKSEILRELDGYSNSKLKEKIAEVIIQNEELVQCEQDNGVIMVNSHRAVVATKNRYKALAVAISERCKKLDLRLRQEEATHIVDLEYFGKIQASQQKHISTLYGLNIALKDKNEELEHKLKHDNRLWIQSEQSADREITRLEEIIEKVRSAVKASNIFTIRKQLKKVLHD